MIWDAIQMGKFGKLNLDVVWLDLAKAYSSEPQHIIQQAPRMYHIPEDTQVLLQDYFNGFKMRFSTEKYSADWINLEVGFAIGRTISPILFALAMEVIPRAAEGSASPADLDRGCFMPPVKAFIDDITIPCSKENKTCPMLVWLDAVMNRGRMSLKPNNSRSLSIMKGKVNEDVCFKVKIYKGSVKSLSRSSEDGMTHS
ncbi:reverse transcriptase [Plakobranchus ocellatus]|uniref:Reverse transcriptase n=1 Tax=Plakobranchus ocellatus TaxID=259542 RepID=A0AAV4A3Q0_9GAST|nr:reverse transcriptase [Plakobranchus ocellatus]